VKNKSLEPDDDDDVYLRLQHGKGFHNLVYLSYVKQMNPASKALIMNATIMITLIRTVFVELNL
jgi:hypothetical protein